MRENIKIDIIEDMLKRRFVSLFNVNDIIKVDSAIGFMIEFYDSYSIENVDFLNKDKDYLFFDYGFYKSQEELPRHFILNISRRFNPKDFNGAYYYDLCFTLHYYALDFDKIDTFRVDSNKYINFQDWLKEINQSVGFKKIVSLCPSNCDIVLIKHKYGW